MLFAGSPETVIVSFTPPTSSATSTSAVPAARTSTPVRSDFLKFGATTSTRYVPGLRFDASYRPSASVSTLRSVPVASPTIRTAAPLSAAPCGSTTVPRMVPRKDCATAGPACGKRMISSHVIARPGAPDRALRPGATACVRIAFFSRWSIDTKRPRWSQCSARRKLSDSVPLLGWLSTVFVRNANQLERHVRSSLLSLHIHEARLWIRHRAADAGVGCGVPARSAAGGRPPGTPQCPAGDDRYPARSPPRVLRSPDCPDTNAGRSSEAWGAVRDRHRARTAHGALARLDSDRPQPARARVPQQQRIRARPNGELGC